jgi:hypothetical protein
MKKNGIKKLQLSRETLQALTSSDCQKAVGGNVPVSSLSGGACCEPWTNE